MSLRTPIIGGILAVAFALLSPFSIAPALAGSVDTNGPFTLVTGRLVGRGQAEALFLWSHEDQKLAVYLVSGRKLELLFSRDCRYDFEVPGSIGEQEPSVRELKGAVKAGKPDADATPTTAPPSTSGYTLAIGRIQGQSNTDALYIWSHAQRRLAVYLIRGNILELLFSRDCSYDLDVASIGQTTPSVRDMKSLIDGGAPKGTSGAENPDGKKK